MSDTGEPKKQLESNRGGSGRSRKTSIGGDDANEYKSFDTSPSDRPDVDDSAPKNNTAVVADRSELIRSGWKAMLVPFARNIVEAETGTETLSAIASTRPHLVVLDIPLGDISGLNVCKQVAMQVPVVVATDSYHATMYFHQLARAGVTAIILKSSGPAALFDAIKLGTRSTPYVDPKFASLMKQNPAGRLASLSQQEQEILIRIDLRNLEISQELNLELKSVESTLERILKKIAASSRSEAASKAIEMGYILLPRMPAKRSLDGKSEEELAAEQHARAAIAARR